MKGQWQKIETAPKDGTPFLAYLKEAITHSRVHVACFHPNVRVIGGHFDFDMPPATHWQPLPEPPEGE